MTSGKFRELRIEAAERLTSTTDANPRWGLIFTARDDDGSDAPLAAVTSAVCPGAYAIGNPGMRPGDTVHVALTRSGWVARIHVAPAEGACRLCDLVTVPAAPPLFRRDLSPDLAVLLDASCCIVLEVTDGPAGRVLRRVAVTNAGALTAALDDARTFQRVNEESRG